LIEIPLTQNKVALIDEKDFSLIKKYKWCAVLIPLKSRKLFYASTWDKIGKNVYMHRLLLDAKNGEEVDHINHDGLDNRRKNLRKGTHRQNQVNRKEKSSSEYPGVFWEPRKHPWRARAQVNGKNINFGNHPTEEKAFKAYQKGIYEITGEWIDYEVIKDGTTCME